MSSRLHPMAACCFHNNLPLGLRMNRLLFQKKRPVAFRFLPRIRALQNRIAVRICIGFLRTGAMKLALDESRGGAPYEGCNGGQLLATPLSDTLGGPSQFCKFGGPETLCCLL